jgi:hypothetical protein
VKHRQLFVEVIEGLLIMHCGFRIWNCGIQEPGIKMQDTRFEYGRIRVPDFMLSIRQADTSNPKFQIRNLQFKIFDYIIVILFDSITIIHHRTK